MRAIFFWKMFKVESKFRKCKEKKIQKTFVVPEIIASENVALNCLSYDENICYGQSMC